MSNLELCCECDEPTGRAGWGEDSLYAGDHGPYCENCWDIVPEELAARVDHLERVNTRATSESDALLAECQILRTEKHADAEAIGALRQALREISCVVSWEINPSNYTHQEVCDINRDFIEIGDIADAALAKP